MTAWTLADLAARGLSEARSPLERARVVAPPAACKGPEQARREGSAAHVLPSVSHAGLPVLCEFEVPGEVRGKGRPRFIPNTGRAYTDPQTVAYERRVEAAARDAMAGAQPTDGPVKVLATAYLRVRRSFSKRKAADCLAGRVFPVNKPDIDNALKLLLDGCTGIVWRDDTQVVEVAMRKVWAEVDTLRVQVEAL